MLDYGRKQSGPDDAPLHAETIERELSTGHSFVGAAKRFKGLISLMILLGLVTGVLVTKTIKPRYVATAQIYIDPRSLPGASKEDIEVHQDSTGFINYIESQVRILGSQLVLDRVVRTEGLAETLESEGGGPLSRWFPGVPLSATERTSAAVRNLAQHITIRRPERTFIIEISVASASPDEAARIANAVVQAYTEVQGTLQTEAAKEAADLFSARLGRLREALTTAEQRVEDYKAVNGIVGAKDFIDEQSLKDLNQQLTLADARLVEARSRYEQVPTSKANGADIAMLAATLNIPTLTNLRNAQAEALQRVADLSTDLGPRHPSVLNANARVAEVQRLLGAELNRVAQSIRKDFERSDAADTGLRRRVDALKRRSMETAQASIKLRELESVVEADRNLYESFLARSRQTAESQQLDAASTHLITAATPPAFRSFPPSSLFMAAIGSMLGAALGFCFALWRSGCVPLRTGTGGPLRSAAPNRPLKASRRAG